MSEYTGLEIQNFENVGVHTCDVIHPRHCFIRLDISSQHCTARLFTEHKPGADTLKRRPGKRAGLPSYARARSDGGKNQRRGRVSIAARALSRAFCEMCTLGNWSLPSPRTILAQSRSGQSKKGSWASHISWLAT